MGDTVEENSAKMQASAKDRCKLYLSVLCVYLVILVCAQFYVVLHLKGEVNRFQHPIKDLRSKFSGDVATTAECGNYLTEKCCGATSDNDKSIIVHEIWKRQATDGNASGNLTCPAGN